MRQHQLMWEPVVSMGGQPILTRINTAYMLKRVVVDRVDAEEGPYDVLHLGTGEQGEGQGSCGGGKTHTFLSVCFPLCVPQEVGVCDKWRRIFNGW